MSFMSAAIRVGNTCESRDWELIQTVLAGDATSFESLVAAHESVVRAMVRRYLCCEEDVRDALQSTWLQVWRNLSRFRGNSQFRSWVIRIAINEGLQIRRQRSRSLTVSIDTPVFIPEVQERMSATPSFDAPFLLRAMCDIPSPYGRALGLHAVEGFTDSEIATLEDISPSAAKSRLHRAKAMFRTQWNSGANASQKLADHRSPRNFKHSADGLPASHQ